jgi:hypothetical protein
MYALQTVNITLYIYIYMPLIELIESNYKRLDQCFPNVFAHRPFCLQKITTDPHILADVNIECPNGIYPKLKIFISELIVHTKCNYLNVAVA